MKRNSIELVQEMLDSARGEQFKSTDRIAKVFLSGAIYAYENCLRKLQENG